MPTIYIDHQPYEVREGLSLLQALLELGFNLPYFCWHPAMGSVGACRQCAIKQFRDANDTRGRIVMACMTPANNNSYISVFDPEALEFRASVTEWLMLNHPHDCPVCDEGGECHLQDMTIMTGHNYRRYRGKKRTFENQYLGPLVNQEMNRCIQCYRCVRFYRDYAGGHDFESFALHDAVFFGRAKDGVLESEFSGNLVEVCPTGVFTDKLLKKRYVRKWDLSTAPSICVNCSVGCNTIPGARQGTLRRMRNRYNSDVNGYFLCDRGRYGYEFVNSERRVRQPRVDASTGDITPETAMQQLSEILAGSPRVIGIGSPRASLESNFALRKLVGAENFYHGVSRSEHDLVAQIIAILQNGPARSPSLNEIATSDAVLLLGEDVSNTAPMIAYSLKQAVRQQPIRRVSKEMHIPPWDEYPMREAIQDERGPLFIATPLPTRIDEIARATFHGAPQDIARLGFAVAHELDAGAPAVENLSDDAHTLAQTIAAALRGAERPLVISGSSLASAEVVQAAANVAWALASASKPAQLSYAVAECNSMGLGLMDGKSLDDALQAAQAAPLDVLIVLENDLFRRMPAAQVDAMLQAARHVIVLDALENPTSKQAEIILPAATFAEGDGSLVNNEGRVQRSYQVFAPDAPVQESWLWLKDILAAAGRQSEAAWTNIDSLQAAMIAEMPVFQPMLGLTPPASFRISGAKIPREPARFSGRTAMFANRTVHEPTPPQDPDSPFANSMEGARLQPPAALIPRFWAPGWNSIQSLNKFQQEIAGPLIGGNPGQRLIEPHGMPRASLDGKGTTSGKLFEASPLVIGPGVPPPEQALPTNPPVQPATPQSAYPMPNQPLPPGQLSFPQQFAQPPAAQANPNPLPGQPAAPGEAASAGQPPALTGQPPRPDFFRQIPGAFEPRNGEWLVIPLYHVFGSDELSLLTPGILELTPPAYLTLNTQDGAAVINHMIEAGQADQNFCELSLGEGQYRLPVHLSKDLPRGVVGLPVLPSAPVVAFPTYGKLAPAADSGAKGGGA